MSIVTLVLSTVAGLLAFCLKPGQAFCVYALVLVGRPQTLDLAIGTIDFSSARIVLFAVVVNLCIRNPGLLIRFRPNILDFFILLFFFGQVISFLVTEPLMYVVENRAGYFVDAILPYFVARFIILSIKDLRSVFLTLILTSIPLSIGGIFESLTGRNVLGGLDPSATYMRHGLYRAQGTFDVHIGFGLFFAFLVPLCFSFIGKPKWRPWKSILLVGFPVIGMVSSMSSAPLFSFYVSCSIMVLFFFRKYWLPLLIAFLVAVHTIWFVTGIPIYQLLTLFAFSGQTAQYRIELYKEAFGGGMTGHWLFGWGDVNVYSSHDRFPWEYKDLVSVYIGHLARTGLFGLVPFILCNVTYYSRLAKGFRLATTFEHRWLIWCLLSSLIGWNIAMLTVAAVSQTLSLLLMMLAFCNNIPLMMTRREVITKVYQKVPVLPRVNELALPVK